MWHDILTAPMQRELELAVIDTEIRTLVFPCLRTERGWINSSTRKSINVAPTHWRWWPIASYFFCCCG
jgi:hypothetical protein